MNGHRPFPLRDHRLHRAISSKLLQAKGHVTPFASRSEKRDYRTSFVSNLFARLSVNRAAKRGREPQVKSKLNGRKPVLVRVIYAHESSHLVGRE